MKIPDIEVYELIVEYKCLNCFKNKIIGFSHKGMDIHSMLLSLTDRKCVCGKRYLVKHAYYTTKKITQNDIW